MSDRLTFDYERAPRTRELIERLRDCTESISLGFDEYAQPQVKGPGLYLAIVACRNVESFADPMGENTWPVAMCQNVFEDFDACFEALATVSESCDGGVVIGVDGTVLEQMVRFRNVTEAGLSDTESLSGIEYSSWMGARHMSALELSLRPESVAAITLSEETGRMTLFDDGTYRTVTRDQIGEPWRSDD